MCCGQTILEKVKLVASLEDITVNNALTLLNSYLQFGGPLVQNTEVTEAYKLSFGIIGNRLKEFNANVNQKVELSFSDEIISANLLINNNGFLLNDSTTTPKGLVGAADYSANYTNNTYVQKLYVDSHLVGKQISTILQNPTDTQNGYTVSWDQPNQKFTLTPGAQISAGADTQIIYNSGGTLVGNNNLIFASNILSAPNINLGISALSGTLREIKVISSDVDVALSLKTKGAGNLNLSIFSGSIKLGDTTSSNTNQILTATGSNGQIDISLEPKGTEGVIYIGNINEAGGNRYSTVRGSATNISYVLSGKGTGNIISNASILQLGLSTLTGARRYILAKGSSGTIDIIIGGQDTGSVVYIGSDDDNASSRFLRPNSSSANINFLIDAKGTGKVFVNGFANWKKIAIGDWNMDTTAFIPIPHGLGSKAKIGVVYAVIISDGGFYYPINTTISTVAAAGSVQEITDTDIILGRIPGGSFDSTSFDSTGFNRGYVYISYEP